MNERVIGRITAINHNNIIVELSQNLGSYITLYDGIRYVGEIGSYVAIDDVNRRIIAEIVSVDEKNSLSKEKFNKVNSQRNLSISLLGEISNNRFNFGVTKMPPIYSEIKIISENDLKLMLDIDQGTIVDDNKKTKLKVIPIGTSVMFPEYQVKVKVNEFFGFHFAVFGNTGSGKSNTIAKLIQNIFSKDNYSAKGAKFIIFDSNGEYEPAFASLTDINPEIKTKFMSTSREAENRLTIPVWALSIDDWTVLLHASDKTQVPILSRALDLIKVFDGLQDDDTSNKVKNHIIASVIKEILAGSENPTAMNAKLLAVLSKFNTKDINLETVIPIDTQKDINQGGINAKTPNTSLQICQAASVSYGKMYAPYSIIDYCNQHITDISNMFDKKTVVPYSLDRFSEAVEFAVLYEGSVSSSKIYEYTSTLLTRLKHLCDSEQGDFFAKTDYATIDEYINSIIGESQILNIDISSLDDTATEVVTKVFSKMLFDYMKKMPQRNSMPVNLILEEAHRFIRSDMDYGVLGYNIFERIAKEGRKFGLLMGISSQRPSELSKTVVSQCSNFIIHKIQNPDDINYISRMVPYVNQGIVDRITYLRCGHALVFGTAINLPTLTAFEKASPSPNSGNSNIVEKWYIE